MLVKKALFVIAASLSLYTSATAQNTIPNPGFENWVNQGTYEDPQDWATLNQETSLLGISTVTKATGTDAHSGTSAIRLETKSVAGQIVPGTAITGVFNPLSLEINGGFSCNVRPVSLSGWYKYSPAGLDGGSVEVILSKWNPATFLREPIGSGIFIEPIAVNTYAYFTATINYVSSELPDTAVIILLSSAYNTPIPGSILFVDDLVFDLPSGISTPAHSYEISIYPNPNYGTFSIEIPSQYSVLNTQICIYNMLGEQVQHSLIRSSANLLINLTAQPSGVYFVSIETADAVKMQKLIVR
ncbi:MAG: hypothetical protein COA57_15570 [Flavobacteriales bacterium]|nr:T9SS type A sorting domain-containing protein [Bacteroidales bacterium AH-315-I05]PCJ79642.1 MAG: hypothetical protein COA57_15570 [Flavobacteriales bacterium]